jgi:hypothetical protein
MSFLLDNFITSSIVSQVVLALHFVYVSCRSRRGRGWSHASLRFELDECGQLSLQRLLESTPSRARREGGAAEAASITTPMMLQSASSESPCEAARGTGVFARLRHRWLQFKQRQLLRCGVFVIPCVAAQHAATGAENQFVLARPAFELRCLRPLQWFADKYPEFYSAFALILIGSKILLSVSSGSDSSLYNMNVGLAVVPLVLSLLMVVHMLGFLSSKRWGIDRVAAKHIAKSFRFVVIAVLLSIDVALDTHIAAQVLYDFRNVLPKELKPFYQTLPYATASSNLFWCMFLLLDCSPQMPSSFQIFITVNDRNFLKACFPQCPAGRLLRVFWSASWGSILTYIVKFRFI